MTNENSIDDNARRILAAVAAGERVDLVDSETGEVLRAATEEEATASAHAGPEGHILVDGRRCYVQL